MADTERGATTSVSVPHARASVGAVRHALADELQANNISTPVLHDAVLVVSELVSNAVKHAAPLPSGEIRIGWSIRRDSLHLEITDGGAMTRPRAVACAASTIGGRGLDIVRKICSAWGVVEAEGSVTVWADLPRAASMQSAAMQSV